MITGINELTPAWLTGLLYRKGMLTAGAVSRVYETHKTFSRVSSRHYLAIHYTADAAGESLPGELFLKLSNPQSDPNSHLPVIFYNQLVPHMAAGWSGEWPFVDCLDAAWSPEVNRSHLLLEDLSETHFTSDYPVPPTRQACERLIDIYAGFHAFWWEHSWLGAQIGAFLTHDMIDGFEAELKARLEQLAETYETDLTPAQFALLGQAVVKWPARRRERVVQGQGVTLVHRDPHPGNILYPHQPDRHGIKLIDWQSWRIDAGTDDLAYLMAFHWPEASRAELERPLLRRYHSRLVELGAPDYTWADCVYDYRASIIRFLGIMTMYWLHQANRERLKLGLQAFVDWECEKIL